MKKYFFIIITTLILFFLVSCNFSKTSDADIINQGFDVVITFDANGGTIGNYKTRKFYCKENTYIFEPGENDIEEPTLQGFVCLGWYRGSVNSNGEVVFGQQFNFKTEKVNESTTLYAKWGHYYTYTIKYMEQTTVIKSETDTTVVNRPSKSPSITGYTFVEYYEDEACTTVFDWSRVHTYDENQNVNVYTKWLEGTYTVLSNASQIRTINTNTNIYLLNDIDFDGAELKLPTTYSGRFVGNGFKFKNFKVVYKQTGGLADVNFALFKNLDNAVFLNVTFEDISISVKCGVGQSFNVGVFSTNIKNTTFENVLIRKSSITIEYTGSSNPVYTEIVQSSISGLSYDIESNKINY